MKNNISKRQRVVCFMEALPDFLKHAKEYEAKKSFPNNWVKPKKR